MCIYIYHYQSFESPSKLTPSISRCQAASNSSPFGSSRSSLWQSPCSAAISGAVACDGSHGQRC